MFLMYCIFVAVMWIVTFGLWYIQWKLFRETKDGFILLFAIASVIVLGILGIDSTILIIEVLME